MKKPRLRTALALLAGGTVLVASAATSFFVIGSTVQRGDITSIRATQFTSADQLVGASDTIVEGVVVSATETVDAGIPATELVFKVETVHRGDASLSTEIIVTQHGTETFQPEHPLLEPGDQHLLFLHRATTSPASSKVHYYVTGVWAGIYAPGGDGYIRSWSHVDRLPEVITSSDLSSLVLTADSAD